MFPKRIYCRHCRYYYITWEAKTPHGCRILRFKSASLPSLVVIRSSGTACLHFIPRNDERSRRGKIKKTI
jgi:hypothetical protein